MLFLIQKEFKQILRNTFLPRLIIAFPIMVVLVLPFAANMDIKNISLGINDYDKSAASKDITQALESSSYFNLVFYDNSQNAAKSCIDFGKCDIIMEIPNGFERSFLRGNGHIGIFANAINNVKGTLGSGYLTQILNTQGTTLLSQKPNTAFIDITKPEILSHYAFNPTLDYKLYMVPALMVMVMTMICGFLPALNIVGEKERGNIEQLNVTPISKFKLIISKLVPYWCIGLVILSLCFILAWLVYGLVARSGVAGYVLIYIFAIVYILVIAGLGLVISNHSNTMQQALFVIYFFVLILVLMSGLFTSIESMPKWAYYLTYINPLRYFMESLRLIFLKGSSFFDIWHNFAALLTFAVFLNLWAVMSYKKRV